jgi:tripartite-type tricarboxylate transporter receptor subunit TctC
MEMGSWFGLLAPKGTPDEAIKRLFEAMKTMEGSKQVQERLLGVGCEVTVSDSPKLFGEYMEQQLKWGGNMLNRPDFKK